MMLNLMERYPMGENTASTAPTRSTSWSRRRSSPYADMLHYVGDSRFSNIPVPQMLDKAHASERAKLIDPAKAACEVTPSEFRTVTDQEGGDTIYLSAIDRHGNIVSLIQSNYSGFGSGLVPKDAGFMLHNRGALFTMEPDQPNTLEPRKRPLHTIIPAFMSKGDVRIGFGIMGGWNQSQGARAVRRQHRRLRDEYPGGARGGPLHQGLLRRLPTCGWRPWIPGERAPVSSKAAATRSR